MLVVQLSADGESGIGEASEHAYYGESVDDMIILLESIRSAIEDYRIVTPEQMWYDFDRHLSSSRFAQCALDCAAHDLFTRSASSGKYPITVRDRLGISPKGGPASVYTIGIDSISNMVADIKRQPWPLYKIKLGTDHDIEIIRALRKVTDSPFCIDANGAWTTEQAIAYSHDLRELGVMYLEQPLAADAWDDMIKVHRLSALPVYADESCVTKEDVLRCNESFHGINIKLLKCGGITPAMAMIHQARDLGMKVMAGCMMESSIGISALAQLVPILDHVDMDSILLLREDIAEGVTLNEQGQCVYPDRPGHGAILVS